VTTLLDHCLCEFGHPVAARAVGPFDCCCFEHSHEIYSVGDAGKNYLYSWLAFLTVHNENSQVHARDLKIVRPCSMALMCERFLSKDTNITEHELLG
jgi:hypothetical protein